jgi:hypothetical protein
MNKVLPLLILAAVLFLFLNGKTKKTKQVSGTGPGYIPAFQGYPEVGVSGV